MNKTRRWFSRACGGHSVVLSQDYPYAGGPTVPSYGFNDSNGFSIGYPFMDDSGNYRSDFVCYTHDDARLIAAAPELFDACKRVLAEQAGPLTERSQFISDAISKAEGSGYGCLRCMSRFISIEARNVHQAICSQEQQP